MLALRFGLSDAARASKTALLLELEAVAARAATRAASRRCWSSTRRRACRSSCSKRSGCWRTSRPTSDKLLSVILAGQPELAERLNDPSLRQLKQRVALRCELRPLTLQETAGYMAGRIRAAGGVGAQVFTREAVTLIHERSQRHAAHDQRDRRQRAADGLCRRPAAGQQRRSCARCAATSIWIARTSAERSAAPAPARGAAATAGAGSLLVAGNRCGASEPAG